MAVCHASSEYGILHADSEGMSLMQQFVERTHPHSDPSVAMVGKTSSVKVVPVTQDVFVDPHSAGSKGLRFFAMASHTEWTTLVVCVGVLCIFDLVVIQRSPNTFKWHLAAIVFWIAVAFVYDAFVWTCRGQDSGTEWLTGYVLEWILSMDNLFVFHLVFQAYHTPVNHIHKAVFVGIIGAVSMRLVFFMVLSSLLHLFHWIRFLFGAFLIWSGIEAARAEDEEDEDLTETRLVRGLKWMLGPRLIEDYDMKGRSMFLYEGGKLKVTMLFVVIVCLELTDLIFAVDSVSAKVSQIPDEYIAFSSSVLAMFGLRAMFFIIHDLVQMFDMLKYGLCLILMFIGIELMLSSWMHLSPATVCFLIIAVFMISIFASFVKNRVFDEKEIDSEGVKKQ